jgi:hypothetical protein
MLNLVFLKVNNFYYNLSHEFRTDNNAVCPVGVTYLLPAVLTAGERLNELQAAPAATLDRLYPGIENDLGAAIKDWKITEAGIAQVAYF